MSDKRPGVLYSVDAVTANNLWLKLLVRRFSRVQHGCLEVHLPGGGSVTLGAISNPGPQASFKLKSFRPLSQLVLIGDLAFAQCYIDGEWECADLTTLFDFVIANESVLGGTYGNWITRTVNRVRHLLNRNSKAGSKRNIAYHYDLGNEFYDKWLDESMTYSSALYETGDETLEEAQAAKYRAVAKMLDLRPEQEILEIGCGWGGFSERAARDHRCRIHGLTLSKEQLRYALERYRNTHIDHLATAAFTDYRDSEGQYDKVVSIEMFEAVGEEHWDDYFQTVYDRLKPGGAAVFEIITIEEERYEAYRRRADFIQRYIFPGGLLPSPGALQDAITRNGLKLERTRYFGQSYKRTCAEWQKRFQSAWDEIEKLGYDKGLKRMWEYYLSYCEAGFKAGSIDVGFFRVVKPA